MDPETGMGGGPGGDRQGTTPGTTPGSVLGVPSFRTWGQLTAASRAAPAPAVARGRKSRDLRSRWEFR